MLLFRAMTASGLIMHEEHQILGRLGAKTLREAQWQVRQLSSAGLLQRSK